MSNLYELKPVGSIRPFTKFCCTIGNLPASYMVSLTFEEQVMWLCDYLKNTIIPSVNNNAEAVKELQELYVKLKDYVDNYFKNLDVQNEINIKLDEMASDGTLENIINEKIFGEINSKIDTLEKNQNTNIKLISSYGAIGNEEIDDSDAIQNCFNDSQAGDTIVFDSLKNYKITKTIFLKPGITLNFNFATIIPFPGNYINNYMFSINSSDVKNWDNPYFSSTTNIYNFKAKNTNLIENLKVFYAPCGLYIKRFFASDFWQLINSGNYYIDYYNLNDFVIQDHHGDEYAILKSQGDGNIFSNIHTIKYKNDTNLNSIQVGPCAGMILNNIINGNLYFYNSRNVSINNSHFEKGNLKIQNSFVEINNSYFWSKPDENNIEIIDNQSIVHEDINYNITLTNCIFKLRYADYSYVNPPKEINITRFNGLLKLINCYRQTELYSSPYNYSNLLGISVQGKSSIILAKYVITEIFNQKLLNKNYIISNNTTNLLLNVSNITDNKTNWNAELKTYYYNLAIILDDKRKLGINNDTEVSFAPADIKKLARLFISNECLKVPILRIYRGTVPGNYTQFVDIPCPSSKFLIDTGGEIGGYAWQIISETTIPEITRCTSILYTNFQNIVAYAFKKPVLGKFTKLDIVIDQNLTENNGGYLFNGSEWKNILQIT